MNRFKAINFAIILCMVSHHVIAQNDTLFLTFESAYHIMHKKNPSIQKAKKEVEQKKYTKQAKQGLYMPKVSVSAQAMTMSDPLHLDLTPVGEALHGLYEYLGNYGVFDNVPYIDPQTGQPVLHPVSGEPIILNQEQSTTAVREGFLETADDIAGHNWNETLQEKTFAKVSANVIWPIFTGGKVMAANKAAGIEVNISQEEVRKTEGELLTELVTRYFGLALALQASEVMKEKYMAMQEHYNDAEKLFEQGIIAKVELLSAKVALSESEREYKSAERMIETVSSGLTATLAFKADTFMVPANNLFINKELPDLDYWLNQTYKTNPLLMQINYKKDLATLKKNVSRGTYLPNIAIMGTYHLTDYQLSPYMPHWMVGAGATWTLFNGMSRQKEIKANTMLTEQVSFIQDKANNELRAYITKLYNELNNKLLEIEELDNTMDLAKAFCASTEKAFSEGFKNSTDVAEAQSKLALVKALRLKTFYSYDITLSNLLEASGSPDQFLFYCTSNNSITETIK